MECYKLHRGREDLEEIFQDNREKGTYKGNHDNDIGPKIFKSDVIQAIKRLKSGKSLGPDEISSETLQLVEL